ncbi:MAG: hypothetical protein HY370_09170 [Proteobacteria bacterium]|nr:hypothetical protein [Pseudomonadota bacterium]
MNEKELRTYFRLQERLTAIQQEVESLREEVYDAFPEIISIHAGSASIKQDKSGRGIIDESILETCRIHVSLMHESPGIETELTKFFPGTTIDASISDVDPRTHALCRELARKGSEVSKASGCHGYRISVMLDEEGAYFDVGLGRDTEELRLAVQGAFPDARIKFTGEEPPLNLKTSLDL